MSEQDSEVSAVLRREAEQLLTELVRDCEHIRGDNCCSECGLATVEAFARRQRAQEAREILQLWEQEIALKDFHEQLQARAAAEGTET